jgi:hypothetical protein
MLTVKNDFCLLDFVSVVVLQQSQSIISFFSCICIQCPEATVAPRFGGFSFNESAELSARPLIPSMFFLPAPSESQRPANNPFALYNENSESAFLSLLVLLS